MMEVHNQLDNFKERMLSLLANNELQHEKQVDNFLKQVADTT